MSLRGLTLEDWRGLDAAAAGTIARTVAERVGGTMALLETVEHLGAPLRRVHIEHGDRVFALVPGGRVRLGFDLDTWRPTPEQAADYAASLAEGFGPGPDLKAVLTRELSPPREAVLDAVLLAVDAEELTESPAETSALLAREGLRLPSADEWEHGCGAGAWTLFRWGEECSLDAMPCESPDGPQSRVNAFGLRIAHDTYAMEISTDRGALHGGDGGTTECGGYGNMLAWLRLATAQRNPDMAEFMYGPEGEDLIEDLSVRPVLDLPTTA